MICTEFYSTIIGLQNSWLGSRQPAISRKKERIHGRKDVCDEHFHSPNHQKIDAMRDLGAFPSSFLPDSL